jgi:UDP-N-acetylglucosamine:LPS N-acetylglucosamine transferase
MCKKLTICTGASAGGHMNQLLKLLEHSECWPGKPDFYITTIPELSKKLEKRGRTYVIGECNRWHPLKALGILFRSLYIVFKERPSVVITTGSLPLALVCFSAKLFNGKIVWIDSIANVERISLSGRMVWHIADLFLVQWPELARNYEDVEYVGELV